MVRVGITPSSIHVFSKAPPDSLGGQLALPAAMESGPAEATARQVIGCAIRAHRKLGPGLYESIYQMCLAREMTKSRLHYEEQVGVSITYDGERVPVAFRADFIVENEVIIEVKSIEHMLPIHDRQVLTYMRLAGIKKGLIFNFNVSMLKQGIRSFVL